MAAVVPATTENLRRAAGLLRAGELVCFPTETVYGLGGDAANIRAVRRIFAAKGRPADHPLIVHLAGIEQLGEWAVEVPKSAYLLGEHFWPGPLTIVLRRSPTTPAEVTGGQETVALRVPGHPVAQRLLQEFGRALAAPSANRFGRISPTLPEHAAEELGDQVELVLDGGPTQVGVESTIVDLTGDVPRLLRPGGVSRDRLAAVLGNVTGPGAANEEPRVPGTLERHYSPTSPARLLSARQVDEETATRGSQPAAPSVLSRRPPPPNYGGRWLQLPEDPEGYARRLYAALRELDSHGAAILIEAPPTSGAWEAVNDRLSRASAAHRQVAGKEGVE